MKSKSAADKAIAAIQSSSPAFAAGKARAAKKSSKRESVAASLTAAPVDASYSDEEQARRANVAADRETASARAERESEAAFNAAAEVSAPVLPEVPVGATHYRLTRKLMELSSSVKHFADDMAALGRGEADTLEFGTLTAAGTFTTNAKALSRDPSAPRVTRAKPHTAEMLAMMDGTKTAAEIAEAIVTKFGGDSAAVLAAVRRLPFHAKRSGKLAKDAKPFATAPRAPKVVLTPEEKAAKKLAKKIEKARALLASAPVSDPFASVAA